MPKFEITAPDGKRYAVDAPAGSTAQDALAYIQKNVASVPEASLEKPPLAAKVGRGMMDLYQGLKQLGLQASDAFTGAKDADAYTKQVGDEIALYEKGRKSGGDTGFDWGRLAGNIATPTLLIPGGLGANLATRIGTGAAAGAAQSGLMFTPEGHSKAAQTAIGAVGGGVAPAVVQGVTNLFSKGANAGANVVADVVRSGMDDSTLTRELQSFTQNIGVDWNKMTKSAQDALKAEATKQLKTGALNPASMERVAKAVALDPRLQLTKGQANRLPADWQTEQNLRGIQGVGDDLRARFGQQGQILGEAADKMRGGVKTDRPFQAGEAGIAAIQKKFEETGDHVSSLYKAAKDTVGLQADVPLGPLQIRAIQVLNDFDDVIPSPIKAKLQALGIERMGTTKATKAFTVEEAETLDKLINARWDASNKPLTNALTQLKGAIKDSLSKIGEDAGTDAAKAFRVAKDAASSRFDEFGERIASAAADDVAPDKFVRRFVVNGDVRDIKSLVKTLTSGTPEQIQRGTEALQSIRAATLTELFEGKGALVDGMLSGAKLDKAMKDVGPDRLRAIFSPEQIKQLELLRGVSIDLTKPPPLADINYSRTSQGLANLLLSVGKIPGLGMVAKVGQAEAERGQRKAVESALAGGASLPRTPVQVMTPAGQNALSRKVSPYTVAPANALLYEANQ